MRTPLTPRATLIKVREGRGKGGRKKDKEEATDLPLYQAVRGGKQEERREERRRKEEGEGRRRKGGGGRTRSKKQTSDFTKLGPGDPIPILQILNVQTFANGFKKIPHVFRICPFFSLQRA
jgi:hypothetical protein